MGRQNKIQFSTLNLDENSLMDMDNQIRMLGNERNGLIKNI